MIKTKTRTINFLTGNLKEIKLKHLVEEKRILKNKDKTWLLYYGIVWKDNFYLTEKIIKSLLKEKFNKKTSILYKTQ